MTAITKSSQSNVNGDETEQTENICDKSLMKGNPPSVTAHPSRRRASTMKNTENEQADRVRLISENSPDLNQEVAKDSHNQPNAWCPSPSSFVDEPLRLVSFVSESGYSALNRRGQRARSFNVAQENSSSSTSKEFNRISSTEQQANPKALMRPTRQTFHFSGGHQLIVIEAHSFLVFFSIDFTLPPSPLINATLYRPFPRNPLYDTREMDPSSFSRLEYVDVNNPIKAGLIKLAQNANNKQTQKPKRRPKSLRPNEIKTERNIEKDGELHTSIVKASLPSSSDLLSSPKHIQFAQGRHSHNVLPLSGVKTRTRVRTTKNDETPSETISSISSPFNLDSPREALLSPSPYSRSHRSYLNAGNAGNAGKITPNEIISERDNVLISPNLPPNLFDNHSQKDSNKAQAHTPSDSPNPSTLDYSDNGIFESLSRSSSSISTDSGIPENMTELFFSSNALAENTESQNTNEVRRRSNSNSVLANNSITSLSAISNEQQSFASPQILNRRAMSVRVPQTGRLALPKTALLQFASSGYVFSSTPNGVISYLLDPTISIDHDFCETLIFTHQAYIKTDVLFKALENLYKTPFRATKPLMKYPQFSHYKEAVRLRVLFFFLLFSSLFSGETLSSFHFYDFISSMRNNVKKHHSKYFTFMFLKASKVNMSELMALTKSDFETIIYTFHLPINDLLGHFQYSVSTSPFYQAKKKSAKPKAEKHILKLKQKHKQRGFLRLQAVTYVQFQLGIPLQFVEMLFDHLISIGWIEIVDSSSEIPLYFFTEPLNLNSLKLSFKPIENVHLLLGAFDPSVVAQQLTLFNARLVSSIDMNDIISGDWKEVEKNPSISKCSEASAHFQLFILQEVLKVSKLSRRIDVLQNLIYIAHYCYLNRNYNTALDILTALNQPLVIRLNQTFKGLNSTVKKLLADLNELFSFASNFKNYRKEIAKVKSPFIPFFAITFRDLTCIHEILDKNENINFQKYSLLKGSVKILADSQKSQYDIQENADIYSLIGFDSVKPEMDLEKLSHQCE